ncbi:major capsid protein [Gordonia phage LittleFella]|nr:major capsid protein [Gordonia phage LittleFella]
MITIDKKHLFLFGADPEGGYQTSGDIVTQTADGTDLNALWDQYQTTLAYWNARKMGLVALFTYPVTSLIENVPQVGKATFEEASEFGEPQAGKIKVSYIQLGYDFKDYDVASRWTWRFLRDADARQVNALHNAYLQADAELVFRKVMEAIFDNRNRNTTLRNQAYNVYPLYNGDGMAPPDYGTKTFQGTHDHYLVSGGAQIDSGDLEAAQAHIEEHGYSIQNGTTIIHMVNKAQAMQIRLFRQGVANNNGAVANYDFIPSENQPPLILPNDQGLLGSRPPSVWNGLRVLGSYNDALIIEDLTIPEGYVLTFGTGGLGQLGNLVGLREHANPAYRGLRLIAGNQSGYPLVDSYYSRSFGTGIRQRGGAVVTQIKASGNYVIPTQYKKGEGLV